MQTQHELTDTHRAIATARAAQKLTTREFAAALDVSQNAVYQWENGLAEPTQERVQSWLGDERAWVKQLGLQVFFVKFGPMIATAVGTDAPTGA